MFAKEKDLSWILNDPEERMRVGKYLITSQLNGGLFGKSVKGLRWVGGYGSFWSSRLCVPGDIDLALDIDEERLSDFTRRVVGVLNKNFCLEVDLFPLCRVIQAYGIGRARTLINESSTIYGRVPGL